MKYDIWTEGKTDWQHLKRAFKLLGESPQFAFREDLADFGDERLVRQCQSASLEPHSHSVIFIFDRDNPAVLKIIEAPEAPFQSWGNNVYSFAIPIPPHRSELEAACIELYYSDEEIRSQTTSGRRLFLSTEFNPDSGRSHDFPNLNVGNKAKLRAAGSSRPRILDDEVYDSQSKNVALSKTEFARLVTTEGEEFSHFGYQPFSSILDIVHAIVEHATPHVDLCFGESISYLQRLESQDKREALVSVASECIAMCKLACALFAACVIRAYDQRIKEDSRADASKIRPIKEILAAQFLQPTLDTYQRLARSCTHLVSPSAPQDLFALRGMMHSTPQLGAIGTLLDALDACFPTALKRGRFTQKGMTRKPLLEFIIAEFARHEGHIESIAASPFLETASELTQGSVLPEAIAMLKELFSPLESLHFVTRLVGSTQPSSGWLAVMVSRYEGGRYTVSEEQIPIASLKGERAETLNILMSNGEEFTECDLYPFLTLASGQLYYYNRTGFGDALGYEFGAPFRNNTQFERTARKFSSLALLSIGDTKQQSLFWAYVEPTTNLVGVRANIPSQQPLIGRTRMLEEIQQEILIIPNQDGIIFGPGGVGKTALLIELTQRLFDQIPLADNTSPEPQFDNIIWISAKEDIYDTIRGEREVYGSDIKSLDSVLSSVLAFHGIADGDEYSKSDKAELVTELFRESKTLLIIDNFESIGPQDQDEIMRFFGVSIKQRLRMTPDRLKVLVTSRELKPSGFHQYEVTGLDEDESRQLMHRLYRPYRRSGVSPLTLEQESRVHAVCHGIPLVIMHCFGQCYEFKRDLESILTSISSAGSNIVEFSFSEVLKLLRQDRLQLQILLLLGISGRPLTSAHLTDLLGTEADDVSSRLLRLRRFRCVVQFTSGHTLANAVGDEARPLVMALMKEFPDVAIELKRRIASLPLEKRLNYSKEERDAATAFRQYVSSSQYIMADDLMAKSLANFPYSIVLTLAYADYLLAIKNRPREAIDRCEAIRRSSGNDIVVLEMLLRAYLALPDPPFEDALPYAKELQELAGVNSELYLSLARFYVLWSTNVRLRPKELDPNQEMLRQQKYKELADTGIQVAAKVQGIIHEKNFLIAQANLNKWDYNAASLAIQGAIRHLPSASHARASYVRLRDEIIRKQEEEVMKRQQRLSRTRDGADY